jgi:hypothetical protein
MKTLLKLTLLLPVAAFAADEVQLVIQDHRFQPTQVVVPAGQKVKLVIHNQDATPEEFESHELNREKVILANSSASLYIGPLEPGRYPFVGEFNENTAQGEIVAR